MTDSYWTKTGLGSKLKRNGLNINHGNFETKIKLIRHEIWNIKGKVLGTGGMHLFQPSKIQALPPVYKIS